MKFVKQIICLSLVFICACFHDQIYAQNHASEFQNDEILIRLFERMDSLTTAQANEPAHPGSGSVHSLETFFSILADTTDFRDPRFEELISEKKIYASDYGLSVQSGFTENIEQGIFTGGDIFYNRRFHAGLHWNILNNGLVSNRDRVNELEFREKMVRNETLQERAGKHYEELYNRVIYNFNLQKLKLIGTYLDATEINLELMHRLYYLNLQPWDQVLELSSLKATLENQRKAYTEYNTQFENAAETVFPDQWPESVDQLPLFDIHIREMVDALQAEQQERAFTHEDLEKLKYNPFSDISLSAFAQYNLFDGTGTRQQTETLGGREYFSVGLNLSVPLSMNISEKRTMAEARMNKLQYAQEREQFSHQKEIFNHYYEYQNNLQQYIRLGKESQLRDETVRKQTVLKNLNDPGFSVQKLSNAILERYAISHELLGVKQLLYLRLIKMDSYLSTYSISDYLEPINILDYLPAKTSRADQVYIWSSLFREMDNHMLVSKLIKHGFSTVYLSIGPGSSLEDKAAEFVKMARQNQVSVELMSGNNELIFFQERIEDVYELVSLASRLNVDGLHLDVEPHTFDDWDEKSDDYKQAFTEMLRLISKNTQEKDLKLSVSIPHFYDSIIREISLYSDRIVVMAYKTNDAVTVYQRVKNELETANEKVAIALRPEDFRSQNHLNNFIEELIMKTGVESYALHDLNALIETENIR